jgi:uncharacterized protein YdeI (YjbR/CyaY-like superfamily)
MSEMRNGLPVLLFADQAECDAWFSAQGVGAKGAWLRFAKKGSGITSVTKAEAIDAALCYGWIDGQLDKYDAQSWLIRFTPRKPQSKWSEVNRTRAEELITAGRMRNSGLVEIERAKQDGRWEAAYAPASKATVPDDLAAALAANSKAKAFFETLTGANRYAILYRIGAVKRAETRARKIALYVAMLEREETLHG